MHVIIQTIGVTGREAALITFKGLFFSMFELVLLKITSLSARIVTLFTPERLLS